MSGTYGRFVLDEDAECVRLRVRSGDSVTLWRAAALAGAGLIAVLPTMAFSGPLMMTLSAILCLCLLGSSMAMASRAGVARSIYPRVRRLPRGVNVSDRDIPTSREECTAPRSRRRRPCNAATSVV